MKDDPATNATCGEHLVHLLYVAEPGFLPGRVELIDLDRLRTDRSRTGPAPVMAAIKG
jgi:hypothetical protein